MKFLKTKIILALLLMFGLTACSSDDDPGPSLTPEEVLQGTWELIALSTHAEFEFEGFFNGSSIVITESKDFRGQITFTVNPKEYFSNLGYTSDYTIDFIIGGQSIDTEYETLVIDQEEISGSWNINENGKLVGLNLNAPEGEYEELEYDIEIISSNQINLRGGEEFTHTEQGITTFTDAELEATLFRVN